MTKYDQTNIERNAKGNMKTKKLHERAVKTCISMPPKLFERAVSEQRDSGFPSLSNYFQYLVRKEMQRANGASEQVVKSIAA